MAMTPKKAGGIAAIIASILGGTVALEQGYSNNPKDPGGATNHGITEKVARAHDYTGDMRDLPVDTALDIYAESYIYKPGFDAIVARSPALGKRVIDGGVNVGTRQMSLWFQRGLNAVSRDGRDFPKVAVDGSIGPGTIASYVGLEKKRGRVAACQVMLKLIDGQQTAHYMSLDKMTDFTYGWVTNRIGHVPLEECNEKPPV